MNVQELINSLPRCAINWDSPRLGSDDDGLPVEARVKEYWGGVMVCVCAEAGDGVADYYRAEYIEPRLKEWAKQFDSYWEWDNPGQINCFIEDKYLAA